MVSSESGDIGLRQSEVIDAEMGLRFCQPICRLNLVSINGQSDLFRATFPMIYLEFHRNHDLSDILEHLSIASHLRWTGQMHMVIILNCFCWGAERSTREEIILKESSFDQTSFGQPFTLQGKWTIVWYQASIRLVLYGIFCQSNWTANLKLKYLYSVLYFITLFKRFFCTKMFKKQLRWLRPQS